jgi:chromate transporter
VASVFQLTFTAVNASDHPITSICVGILAFGATDVLNVPAPIVVVGGGVIGIIAWAAGMK